MAFTFSAPSVFTPQNIRMSMSSCEDRRGSAITGEAALHRRAVVLFRVIVHVLIEPLRDAERYEQDLRVHTGHHGRSWVLSSFGSKRRARSKGRAENLTTAA
jgi:hypothetical protein